MAHGREPPDVSFKAAVAGVQIDRLDELVGDMHAQVTVEGAGGGRDPAERRQPPHLHDPSGGLGLALIFFLDGADRAERAAALADDNVPATRLYSDGRRLPLRLRRPSRLSDVDADHPRGRRPGRPCAPGRWTSCVARCTWT